MSDHSLTIETYLSTSLAGAILGQIAAHRGLDLETLVAHDSHHLNCIGAELTALGINPETLAQQTLTALALLFVEPSNAELVISNYTQLLWSILGDPERGGGPPELYRKAGTAMHLTLISLLDPAIYKK
ncbi:MAG: hypothetical protein ACO3LH_05640 [Steroidobacteraceae bacterium]